MARMLRNHPRNYGDFGCCDMCARKKKLIHKPGPRERHLARQREKRQWRREALVP
jgi:hypothetical protein